MKKISYLIISILLITTVYAQFPPDDVSYFVFEAKNATSNLFYDGSFTVIETIYDALTAGNSLKTQTSSYTISNGTWVGKINDTGIDWSAQFFIEFNVSGDTLSPRIPYVPSIQTQTARNVTEINFNSTTITGRMGINNLSTCGASEIIKFVAGGWQCASDAEGDNNFVTAATFTGTNEKTLTLTRSGLGNVVGTFTDIGNSTFEIRNAINDTSLYNINVTGVSALAGFACAGTDKVSSFLSNSSPVCTADGGGAAGNPFDQVLNTTSNVTFANIVAGNWSNVTLFESQILDLQSYVTSEVNDTLFAFYLYPNGTNPPSASYLVNKEYVDSAISGLNFDFFLTNETSDVSGYFNMTAIQEVTPISSETSPTFGISDGNSLINFSTIVGQPEFTTIVAGVFDVHVHLFKTGTKTAVVYWEFYKSNSTGEFLLFTSEDSESITTTSIEYNIHGTLANDLSLISGDRLVVKFYTDISGGGSSTSVTLEMEGNTASRLEVRVESQAFNDIFVRRADWTTIDDYPADCAAGFVVKGLGDTLTCVQDAGNTTQQMRDAVNISATYLFNSTGLTCTNCLNTDQIQDLYVLNTGDQMTGDLNITSFNITDSFGHTIGGNVSCKIIRGPTSTLNVC